MLRKKNRDKNSIAIVSKFSSNAKSKNKENEIKKKRVAINKYKKSKRQKPLSLTLFMHFA